MTIRFTIILFCCLFLSPFGARASTVTGTIDSSFAMSLICHDVSCTDYGMVNFKPSLTGETTGLSAIIITESGITGNAWGNEIGWINFSPAGGGVTVDSSTGELSGLAWSSVGSWINFSPTDVSGGMEVGVSIMPDGSFSGWAWVSGMQGGWMRFDCANSTMCVKTDWRPVAYREACQNGIDDDNDGSVDTGDSGCASADDTSETQSSSGTGNTTGGSGGSSGGGSGPRRPIPPLPAYPLVPVSLSPALPLAEVPARPPIAPARSCALPLAAYIRLGRTNVPAEVRKLQDFLRTNQGETGIRTTGVYTWKEHDAVVRFQEKYARDILVPWGLSKGTGYVYITTTRKINELLCRKDAVVFTKDLSVGARHDEVRLLQEFLNRNGFPVSPAGIGSSGMEISLFTSKTRSALARFQEKYRPYVYAQSHIYPRPGVLDAVTRHFINTNLETKGFN
ncbi:MAG: peptidoglycan-binding domain-containing protein [Patescibacteria group bacterium]